MMNFLGLNKKNRWKDCAILKNSWVALAMRSRMGKELAQEMKKLDTPGDEITLYTLCKMYRHHCFVFTKAKSWCTVDTDIGLDEEELIDKCDIVLMFIEPGVYGELKSRPYAPPPRQALLQDATADLPRPGTSSSTETTAANRILDLTSPVEPAMNNNTIANGNNTNLTEAIDIQDERNVDTLPESTQKEYADKIPNDHQAESAAQPASMLKCVVNLTRLTENDIDRYACKSLIIGGYSMRQ